MRSATSPRRSRFSGSSTSRSPPQSCCSGFTSGRLAWTWATRNVDASWRSSRPEVPLRASSLDSCSSKRHSGERSLRSWASLREWALSRLLLTFVSPFSTPTAPRYEVIVLTPSTVVIVTILSVIFMAITSIRSARRTARIPIVETLRYYAPGETRIQYRPWVDILLITLAIVTYGMVLYTRTNPQDFFTFRIGALFFIILPFTPIFLIVGTTRLLTRSTGRVYEWTARVCKPFAKNLYYVISRNLRRNPRRSANVAVIIALGIAFGMFILVTFSSQLAYQERQARAAVGADLALDAPTSNSTFAANLSAVPEVAGVTRVQSVPVSPPYCCAGVYALDPATFFAVTNPEPWYFGASGGAEAARQVLATPGQVRVTEPYLRNAYLAVGDRLRLDGSVFNGTTYNTVTVNTTR